MRKILLLICFPAILLASTTNVSAASSTGDVKEAAAAVTPEPVVGSAQDAMKEFKSLSKQERKERVKEAKKAIKQFKADKKAGSEASTNTLLQVILAILLPPLAVYLHEGEINNRFWIDLILTLLLFLPGVIYALIVVLGG
jgi:uncharacterized membrane protein YqaE (UPF0057 family)